jgi:hypothetical protein
MRFRNPRPVWFLSFLLSTLYPLLSTSHGIEGHTVPPAFTPVDSLFSLSFIPVHHPPGQGIPGRTEPKPYALLGLGNYSTKDRWTYGGRAEGRLSFLSGTARGLAVRKTDFGRASENDFSLQGSVEYRPTGRAGFEARFRGIETGDELGTVRRTANAFAISFREADRRGRLTVRGSWTEIYLDAPEHAHLRVFSLVREGERLFGLGTLQGRVREAWVVSEEQGGEVYRERLWGKAFLAAGLAFGNRFFLEAGIRAAGYSALARRDAFAYPFLSLHAAHPGGYSADLSFEPGVSIPSFEERYLHDPYLRVNPLAGYSRSPVRFTESFRYGAPSRVLELRFAEERRVNLWVPQDAAPGFLILLPYGEAWRYSLEARASTALGSNVREGLEVRGCRAHAGIPYDPEISAANTLTIGRGLDSLRVRADYVGKRSRPDRESLRDYVLTSVALESQVYPGIAVSFSAENLGDNRYELIAGRTHQGRAFSLGLTGRL